MSTTPLKYKNPLIGVMVFVRQAPRGGGGSGAPEIRSEKVNGRGTPGWLGLGPGSAVRKFQEPGSSGLSGSSSRARSGSREGRGGGGEPSRYEGEELIEVLGCRLRFGPGLIGIRRIRIFPDLGLLKWQV